MTRSTVKALLLACLAATPAAAQTMPPMPGMKMPAPSGSTSPSSQAFKSANDKMMRDMNVPMTGNTDQDFVATMIPHHAGAVDMAQTELKYGRDPQLLALARSIVAAQQKEIAEMTAWRKAHPSAK
jgi:uncharacterized protein (DUF305 family)